MQVQTLVEKALRRARPVPPGLKEPPRLSGGLPVVGHTVEFVRGAIELLTRAERELGEVAAFQVAHMKMVAFFGPEAHQAFFRAPDEQLSPSEAYKIMTPVFGEGIVYDAPPERMDEQLKMLLPALKDRRMRTYGETILDEVQRSLASFGAEGELDLVDYCRVLTNFTSSRCLLGPEFRDGMTEEFAQVYHDLERGITPIAYINAYLPLPSFRRRDQARVKLVSMITRIIEDRRRAGREGEDFLQTLMDSKYKSGQRLSHDEITGMLLASMFAGHHTSSVTTAWTLLELLRNPRCLKEVMAELEAVYGEDDTVTYQSLRDIVKTERAVKETLRLHPPLFMLLRAVMEDFEYKGYHVPAGSRVVVTPFVAHRMRSQFRDPERFDPDRFNPEREEDKVPFAFIPFGGGRHKCMGSAFAYLQVKAIIAVLLRTYEFELSGDPIASDFHGLVVGPKQPCRIRYRRRRTKAVHAMPGAVERTGTNGRPVAGMKITVDTDLCQGHAVCTGEAPTVFEVGPNERVRVLDPSPAESLHEKVRLARKHCPTGAITVTEG